MGKRATVIPVAKNSRVASPEPARLSEKIGANSALWTDDVVAGELGVAVELIATLRGSACSAQDVSEVRGVPVFTLQGRETIRRAIEERLRAEKLPPGTAGERALGFSPARAALVEPVKADLTVTRVIGTSTQLLAQLPNGNEVPLRVRKSDNLRPGMVLRDCVQDDMGWTYHGRLPRTFGERQLFFPRPATAN